MNDVTRETIARRRHCDSFNPVGTANGTPIRTGCLNRTERTIDGRSTDNPRFIVDGAVVAALGVHTYFVSDLRMKRRKKKKKKEKQNKPQTHHPTPRLRARAVGSAE